MHAYLCSLSVISHDLILSGDQFVDDTCDHLRYRRSSRLPANINMLPQSIVRMPLLFPISSFAMQHAVAK